MTQDALLARLASDIGSARRQRGGAYVVGVTGADASGKSTFAALLVERLSSQGEACQLIHVDDFHRPRAERYAGHASEPEKYLGQSIDFERLLRELLLPVKESGTVRCTLRHLDIAADTWSVERNYQVDERTTVVVEGVFLLQPPVRACVDCLIFLDVDEAELLARGMRRDQALHGPDVRRRYVEKYLPAQRTVLSSYSPERFASVIIDNNDWRVPTVVRWRI